MSSNNVIIHIDKEATDIKIRDVTTSDSTMKYALPLLATSQLLQRFLLIKLPYLIIHKTHLLIKSPNIFFKHTI